MGFPASYPLGQQMTITLISAVSGSLSILGSSTIVYSIIAHDDRRRSRFLNVKYRYLLGLCCADILNSAVHVTWSLPFPRATPNVWGAIGNKHTCDYAGFMHQLGGMGSIYQAALTQYFYQTVCHGMSSETIAQRYEKPWHLTAVLFPLVTAATGLLLDTYSVTSNGCWFMASPFGCQHTDDVTCERGEWAALYAWLFMGIPLLAIMAMISYHMMRLYRTTKTLCDRAGQSMFGSDHSSPSTSHDNDNENNNSLTNLHEKSGISSDEVPTDKEQLQSLQENEKLPSSCEREATSQTEQQGTAASPPPSSSNNNNMSLSPLEQRKRKVGAQAILYVMAYLVTHTWAFLVYHMDVFGVPCPFWLQLLNQLFWPIQGFLNVFIFLRPRIDMIQTKLPGTQYLSAVYLALFCFDNIFPSERRRASTSGGLSRQALTRAISRQL